MATKFSMTRDINGYNGFGRKFSDTCYQINLASGVEKHFTVPSNPDAIYSKYLAIMSFYPSSSGTAIWVANNDTATLPSGNFTATTCEANPVAMYVEAGDVLSFITNSTTAEVGVAFYAVQ
jgi:hypothetical protein